MITHRKGGRGECSIVVPWYGKLQLSLDGQQPGENAQTDGARREHDEEPDVELQLWPAVAPVGSSEDHCFVVWLCAYSMFGYSVCIYIYIRVDGLNEVKLEKVKTMTQLITA